MVSNNPFPAVLLAGPPHCGKSVLAYQISLRLRTLGIQHYLLRAVPDGEGDWYLKGEPALVQEIRIQHKLGYTDRFISHMVGVINHRALPLLVDAGGKPVGLQWGIPAACTHSILLYHEEKEYLTWRKDLAELNLIPLAELCSDLEGCEGVNQTSPFIKAVIKGLNRFSAAPETSQVIDLLVERMSRLFQFDAQALEQAHLAQAPYPVLSEQKLATELGLATGVKGVIWSPRDLPRATQSVGLGQSFALYGRGPVWLAAALAGSSAAAPCAIFDLRNGWIDLGRLPSGNGEEIRLSSHKFPGFTKIEVVLPTGLLELTQAFIPPIVADLSKGIVLSGKLPRWLFAGIVKKYADQVSWIGVFDPGINAAVVVVSRGAEVALGEQIILESEIE